MYVCMYIYIYIYVYSDCDSKSIQRYMNVSFSLRVS